MGESEGLNEDDLSETKEHIITPKELEELRKLEEIEECANFHPPLARLSIEEEKKLTQLREKETCSGVWKKIRKFLRI